MLLPAGGAPILNGNGVTCKYPINPTVTLGYLSIVFLIGSTLTGYLSLFYPYKGKSLPQGVLFKHTTFMVFFNIASFTTGLAATMLLWPTITEQIHLSHKVHSDVNYECPTAKTSLLGALMLVDNVREDFFNGENGDKGEFGNASSDSYDSDIGVNGSS
ncbi:hypothetical protein Lalb_Chr14g0362051 [Lupinus albus]|uniref:Uncharacterized protein n=1 Tax=Lupinus albus TaxID=3870 RepID=A0A6A4PAS2_LUPAL|nr:hypothetical protein Lalb_Chr14g0362051 [Lupinus albus]